jgi:alkylation response protein AidB-like acyl-CoA dehydrogenase
MVASPATITPPLTSSLPQPDVLAWLRAELPTLDQVPLPGQGRTLERWRYLAGTAADHASRARLAEGHLDALAILSELDRRDLRPPGSLWGVWAAQPATLRATPTSSGWQLQGTKAWCSGSRGLDEALVTATSDLGPLLFAVPTDDLGVIDGSWQPLGMEATASHTVLFDLHLSAHRLVGRANSYVDRPGFWHGGIGVAACWYGAATGVARALADPSRASQDPYLVAARGRSVSRLHESRALLRRAADEIDLDPANSTTAQYRAMDVRLAVSQTARRVLDTTVAVLGADPLCHDPDHVRRVADLTVYLSQHHGDRDAAAFGGLTGATDLEL